MFPMFVRCLNFKFVTNMALTHWPSYTIIDHVGLARCKAMYLRENRFVCRCMGCAWDLPTLGMGLTYPGIILPVVFSAWHGHLSSLQKRHHLTNWQPELVLHTLVAWRFFTNPSVKKMQPSNFQIFPQPSGWTWTTIFELPAPSEVGVLPPIFFWVGLGDLEILKNPSHITLTFRNEGSKHSTETGIDLYTDINIIKYKSVCMNSTNLYPLGKLT